MATTAPRLPESARLAIICSSISNVSVRSLPGIGGVKSKVRMTRPWLLISTSW